MKLASLCTAIVFLVANSIAQAVPIAVTNVTPSSTFYTYNPVNLTNGSGLTGNLHSGDWQNKWMTDETVTGSVIFDLGSVFDVGSSSVWNYGGGCCGAGRSVKDLSVEASVNGVTYFNVGDFVLDQVPTDPIPSQSIALNVTAQFFRFNLNSNYGDTYTGLSEVQFFEGSVVRVPAPATLMLLGLGLAGVGYQRRKQTKAA